MEHVWTARWIQDPRFSGLAPRDLLHPEHQPRDLPAHEPGLRNVHMLVRKEFDLPEPPGRAELLITADDYYLLYINGEFVGQGPAPAYHFRYNVNAWDVSDRLTAGRNVIAVHVYYQGLRNRVWNSADYRQGMLAELVVRTAAGGHVLVASDATWRMRISEAYRAGPIIAYDTQFAEDIDGRLLERGWQQAGFDDAAWTAPAERAVEQTDYTFVMQSTPPPAVYDVEPVEVRRLGQGRYRLDFGREITGRLKVRVAGPAGHRIEVRCGEELEPDGSVRYRMRCNCDYQDFYTLAGVDGEQVEFFDYKAFRYAEVLGAAGEVGAGDVRAIVRHYPWPDSAATLRTSNPVLDEIWAICANGVRCCCQETIVDCPSREKGQYLNDAAVSAHAHMLLTGDTRLTRKALADAAASGRFCPGLAAVAPGSFMQEIAEASLLWPVLLREYYLHSGDEAFLREMLPVLDGLVHYFQRHENEGGLLADLQEKWNLVDWPANARDGYDFDLSPRTGGQGCQCVLNGHYYRFLEAVADCRLAAGLDVARAWQRRRAAFTEAFTRTFQDSRTGLFVDAVGSNHSSLHANAMALCAGLVSPAALPAVLSLLQAKGMACGVWFASFLLQGLIQAGQSELAIYLMTRDDPRSWQNMLGEDATACFEAWGVDQKWNTSLCHAWAAGPVALLVEGMLGVQHVEAGWRAVRIEPRMPRMLQSVALQLPLPAGTLNVSYSRSGRLEICSVHLPREVRLVEPSRGPGCWQVRTADAARGAWLLERTRVR